MLKAIIVGFVVCKHDALGCPRNCFRESCRDPGSRVTASPDLAQSFIITVDLRSARPKLTGESGVSNRLTVSLISIVGNITASFPLCDLAP